MTMLAVLAWKERVEVGDWRRAEVINGLESSDLAAGAFRGKMLSMMENEVPPTPPWRGSGAGCCKCM